MHGADDRAVLLGEFEKGAVPQPDPLRRVRAAHRIGAEAQIDRSA